MYAAPSNPPLTNHCSEVLSGDRLGLFQSTPNPVSTGNAYASGSTASLSCFAMRALTTCVAGISMVFPGRRIAARPRLALLPYERRDAGQRAFAGILQLPLAQSLQLLEELAHMRTAEVDVERGEMLDEMREQLSFAHLARDYALDQTVVTEVLSFRG